jgi:archaemetzincin
MVKYRQILLWLFAISFGLAGLLFGWKIQNEKFTGKVALVMLGKQLPERDFVKQEIEQFYHFKVTKLPSEKLPPKAYYKPRNRYKANLILDRLAEIKPASQDKIIALTKKDISAKTTKSEDWGIIGLARLGGECCVVSTYRLKKYQPTEAKFKARLAKVSLHEVGHTLGLKHCESGTTYCLMNDAKGLVSTVDKAEKKLCKNCFAKIAYTRK